MLAGFDGELCRCDSVRAVVANVPDELYQPGILVDASLTNSDFSRARCGGIIAQTDAVGEALQEAHS